MRYFFFLSQKKTTYNSAEQRVTTIFVARNEFRRWTVFFLQPLPLAVAIIWKVYGWLQCAHTEFNFLCQPSGFKSEIEKFNAIWECKNNSNNSAQLWGIRSMRIREHKQSISIENMKSICICLYVNQNREPKHKMLVEHGFLDECCVCNAYVCACALCTHVFVFQTLIYYSSVFIVDSVPFNALYSISVVLFFFVHFIFKRNQHL